MICWKENCKTCKKESFFEYITEVSFAHFREIIKWGDIVFFLMSFIIFCKIFGWIGFIIAFIFIWLMGRLEGGAVGDLWGDYPKEEYPPNTCSAGIENCEICDNEYTHEFNEKYEKII